MQPSLGNTVAMAINTTNSAGSDSLRVKFEYEDESAAEIDAVNCTDLYAEQIESERNQTVSTSYFTDTFVDDVIHWVCPNVT